MLDEKHNTLDEAYQKVVMAINNTSFSDVFPGHKEKLLNTAKAYYDMRINLLATSNFEDSAD